MKKIELPKLKFFNPTLESFKIQCNNSVFRFKPQEMTEVPYDLAEAISSHVEPRGCFVVYDNENKNQFNASQHEALENYVKKRLGPSISFYEAHYDEARKAGRTIIEDKKYLDMKRWRDEIKILIKMTGPIEESLSFLTEEQRKSFGIKGENLIKKEPEKTKMGASANV